MNKRNVLMLLLAWYMSNSVCMNAPAPITEASVIMLKNMSASIEVPQGNDAMPYLESLTRFFDLVTRLQKKDPSFGFNYDHGVLTRLTDDAPNIPRRQGLELVERILRQHVLRPLLFERPKYFKSCQVGVSLTLINYFVNCCPNLRAVHTSRVLFTDLAAYCFMGNFTVCGNFPRNTPQKQQPVLDEVEHLKDLVDPHRVRVGSVTPIKVGTGVAIVVACLAIGYGVYMYCCAVEQSESDLQEDAKSTADTDVIKPIDA